MLSLLVMIVHDVAVIADMLYRQIPVCITCPFSPFGQPQSDPPQSASTSLPRVPVSVPRPN
jgi:hypothetical protein